MSIINKITNNTAAIQLQNNKAVSKKNESNGIDSSEKVAKTISVASDMDMEKVARLNSLAEQIKNKTFTVSHEAIAEKMVQDKGMINLLLS